MFRKDRSTAAFTLVELLVIIAIMSLLLAMLMPILSNVRGLTQQVKCRNQYRQIGLAMHGFAAVHDGRAPRAAYTFTTDDSTQWIPLWSDYGGTLKDSIGWASILNNEYFHSEMITRSMPYRDTDDMVARKSRLVCPVVQNLAMNYTRREMLLNKAVEGGESAGSYYRLEGPYGRRVDPAPAPWHAYVEGAILAQFPQPSYQFALWEAEVSSDSANGSNMATGGGTTGFVTDVTLCAGYPLYCGIDGKVAFRHTLPNDKKLYATRGTANFLFIDGHAESLAPNTKIKSLDRYNFK